MGVIFKKSPLATDQHQVGEEEVTLYRWSSSIYFTHLLREDGVRAILDKEGKEASADEVLELTETREQQLLQHMRNNNDYEHDMCAASIQPGFPDVPFEDLVAELKVSLDNDNLRAMLAKVQALNGMSDPKPEGQTDDSSSD